LIDRSGSQGRRFELSETTPRDEVECPLRVISGHRLAAMECPLWAKSPTLANHPFDHFVSAGEERLRHGAANLVADVIGS